MPKKKYMKIRDYFELRNNKQNAITKLLDATKRTMA